MNKSFHFLQLLLPIESVSLNHNTISVPKCSYLVLDVALPSTTNLDTPQLGTEEVLSITPPQLSKPEQIESLWIEVSSFMMLMRPTCQ